MILSTFTKKREIDASNANLQIYMTHYLPSVISCSNTLLPLLLPRATPSPMRWIPLCSLLLSSISYYPHLILKKNTTTKLNLPWFSSPITALSHLHNQKPETFILIYIHLNFFSLLQSSQREPDPTDSSSPSRHSPVLPLLSASHQLTFFSAPQVSYTYLYLSSSAHVPSAWILVLPYKLMPTHYLD